MASTDWSATNRTIIQLGQPVATLIDVLPAPRNAKPSLAAAIYLAMLVKRA
jgi:hypothetical protein